MMIHKNSMIGASITMRIYACYCDRKNYMKIAQLCLALGIQFSTYSDEYLVFTEDVTDILKRNDATLEFRIDREIWGTCGNILGHEITIEAVSTKEWNFGNQEYDEIIYHKQ